MISTLAVVGQCKLGYLAAFAQDGGERSTSSAPPIPGTSSNQDNNHPTKINFRTWKRGSRMIWASHADLAGRRTDLASRLAEIARLLPELPQTPSGDGPAYRDVSLEELAQTGALVIRRAVPRPADSEPDPASTRARGRILTSQDIARAVPPSGTDEIILDEVRNPAIRAGDVLVPLIVRRLTARVAGDEDVGAYLSPTVYLIRPDTAALDPWFLAGVLSSTGGGRQAARMASTLGDRIRFDPRRVRVPLLPIEDQRAYGESFRRIWDFTRTLRTAYDEGTDLGRV
jgi:hypothetical protein